MLLVLLALAIGLLWGTKLLIDYITSPPQSTEDSTIEIIPTYRPDQNSATTPDDSTSPVSEPNKTPVKHEGDSPNHSSGLTGSITYADISEDKLIIRVNIDQLVGENGTCVLTLSRAGYKDITKSVNTMDNPSSSTCQGFDVPLREIYSGIWQVKIELSAGGKLGAITGEVNV